MVRKSGFSHESSYNESVEWYTPPQIFDALNTRFDLDPCSPGANKCFVPANRHLTIVDDGLRAEWDGFVWCNPPYGRETGLWLKRLAEHGNGICLVFSRTGSRWFQDSAQSASSVCFVAKRIKFISGATGFPVGTPGADSLLLGWGDRADDVLFGSGLGVIGRLYKPVL